MPTHVRLSLSLVTLCAAFANSSNTARAAAAADPAAAEQPTATLRPSSGEDNGFFGLDGVAVDGDVIAIGAWRARIAGVAKPGAVYVFVKPAAGWSEAPAESAILVASTPSDRTAGEFGRYLAMRGDVIVVGEPYTRPGADGGRYARAFVYVKPASGWSGVLTESAVLRVRPTGPPTVGGTRFGYYFGIEGDIIVATLLQSREVFVFQKPESGWSGTIVERARLKGPPPAQGAAFGTVRIDHHTVAVSDYFDNTVTQHRDEAVYVYERPAGGWHGDITWKAKLVGCARMFLLDLSGDTIAAGSCIYARPSGGWVDSEPAARLGVAPDTIASLALGSSSTVVLSPGPSRPGDPPNSSAASIFRRPEAGWSGEVGLRRRLVFEGKRFSTVASDGATTVVGMAATSAHRNEGRAYVFAR